jgi:hemerythrin-like domain-containing protein
MEVTRCLREEHDLILRVLDAFAAALQQARRQGIVRKETIRPFVEFLRDFIEQCHDLKEENALFTAIEKSGVPTVGGPIGAMLHEHEVIRGYVRTIDAHLEAAERNEPEASSTVMRTSDELLALLRQHIDKSNHCLFGMAEKTIHGAERDAVLASYQNYEKQPGYQETDCRCRRLADVLIATHLPRSDAK